MPFDIPNTESLGFNQDQPNSPDGLGNGIIEPTTTSWYFSTGNWAEHTHPRTDDRNSINTEARNKSKYYHLNIENYLPKIFCPSELWKEF